MTAEVAVINQVGVALAADSAVTIGPRQDKIWTSAEKLFQLSECDPIGVMIYGNAQFSMRPWETLIKAYRAKHGMRSRNSVRDHAAAFFRFLETDTALIPVELRDSSIASWISALWRQAMDCIHETLDETFAKKGQLVETQLPAALRAGIAKFARFVRGFPKLNQTNRPDTARILARLAPDLDKRFSEIFEQLPFDARSARSLRRLPLCALQRRSHPISPTGIVFAGFGAKEYAPSLHAFELDLLLNDRIRRWDRATRTARPESGKSAAIIPFAQQEMVHAFLGGIDTDLFQYICRTTETVLATAFSEILEGVRATGTLDADALATLESRMSDVPKALFADWGAKVRDYWMPVVANIETLPKDELAAMAESFVNLTKFRRRASFDRETVGGPIDVAVITKGDGFIWVRRKHYFDLELNPRVQAKYTR
jgi:hypothetical protein